MRVGNLKAIVIAASVVWAAGCSTTSTTDDAGATKDSSTQSSQQGSATTSGATGSNMTQGSMGHGMSKADVMKLQTVFYFDFDKAVVKTAAFEDLAAHAKYLIDNPSASVVLEGHADERGTREYNMALGERRAKAVSRYLTVQGVSSSQVETVSFGEERPDSIGHNEASWDQNRRVELKY
ncbi:MAG: peptidoglycan-associated lipoprotein Pal [Motiliproteus sp.]